MEVYMEKEVIRFLATAALILGVILVSYMGGSISGHNNYNSPLQQLPVDQYVSVSGRVSQVQEDYTSKKGYEYQQFLLSDGSQEVKIFCSKYKGSAKINLGDEISLKGRFQKYYNTYEIYLYCSDIEIQA
jgi:hypothetical protein